MELPDLSELLAPVVVQQGSKVPQVQLDRLVLVLQAQQGQLLQSLDPLDLLVLQEQVLQDLLAQQDPQAQLALVDPVLNMTVMKRTSSRLQWA